METHISLHFLNQFRQARAKALSDSEAFHEIIYAVERLGLQITKGQAYNLEGYEGELIKLANGSDLAETIPKVYRAWHLPFSVLYKIVKTGRNDALHQGAFARHLTDHSIQLLLVLEDALMGSLTCVSDYMVRDPICAFPWQPISFVRQQMLANSFTNLPILRKVDRKKTWYIISDHSVAQYLRSAPYEQRNSRLATQVGISIEQGHLEIELATTCNPDKKIDDVLGQFQKGKPMLVIDTTASENILGILTPFDLL